MLYAKLLCLSFSCFLGVFQDFFSWNFRRPSTFFDCSIKFFNEFVLSLFFFAGFKDYKKEAEAVLNDCKQVAAKRRRKNTRLEALGIPEEELLRQQQELIAKAREHVQQEEQAAWCQMQVAAVQQSAHQLHNRSHSQEEDDDDEY